MAHLLQIHEPGQTPAPHAGESIAIGIDLGTTNTVAAIAHDGKVEILTDEEGQALIPSAVDYGAVRVRSIKRLMGKSAEQVQKIQGMDLYPIDANAKGMARLMLDGKSVTPVEISAEILKLAKARAERALGKKVDKAVITVPAYFDDAARTATRDAARLAGLEVLRLLNEPTAASVAYGLAHAAEGIYAVYDLGGGTFDVSILKLEKGVFRVLATGGDTQLGGDDFDAAIAEHWIVQHKLQMDAAQLRQLLLTARVAKEFLSGAEFWRYQDFSLTREELDEILQKPLQRTLHIFMRVLADAQIDRSQLREIILVGGSTRLPLLQQKLNQFAGKPPLNTIDPDTAVAAGAAIQAEALTKGASHLLLDVLPLSLGIETYGGLVSKIIERNTPIPTARAQEFTTHQDGQGGLALHVVQGERETASDCRSLARFELFGIPPMTAGVPRIRVTFTVDADGLLTVSAEEKTTGAAQRIEVQPSYGLNEEEMADMLRQSLLHGAEDMQKRLLLESRVEAERLIGAINQALSIDGAMLPQKEQEKLAEKAKMLQKLLSSGDRTLIQRQMEQLEQEFLPFAQTRLDKAIAEGLSGKNIKAV